MLKSSQLGGGIPLRKPFSPERGFNYVQPIRITSHQDTTLKKYSIRFELNKNNFDFDQARSDGADIRFRDSNRRNLDYYIHSWNTTTKTASVSVQLDELEPYDETYIWLFTGKENAISQSVLEGAYLFYDNFNYPWTSTNLNAGDHADWDAKWGTHKWTSGTSAISDAWSERLYTSYTTLPNVYEGWETARTFSYPLVVEFRLRKYAGTHGQGKAVFRVMLNSSSSTSFSRRDTWNGALQSEWRLYEEDGSAHSYSETWGGPSNLKIIFDNSDFKLFIDDNLTISTTNNVELPYVKSIAFSEFHGNYTMYYPIDNFKVTTYSPNPPTYEFL